MEIVRVDETGELAEATASGEWKRRRKIALVANVLANVLNDWPKITPQRNQACQPKHRSQINEGLLSYTVDRYAGKRVTTGVPMGSCVCHFTVGDAESLSFQAQLCLIR